jgi:hypothetical protein
MIQILMRIFKSNIRILQIQVWISQITEQISTCTPLWATPLFGRFFFIFFFWRKENAGMKLSTFSSIPFCIFHPNWGEINCIIFIKWMKYLFYSLINKNKYKKKKITIWWSNHMYSLSASFSSLILKLSNKEK